MPQIYGESARIFLYWKFLVIWSRTVKMSVYLSGQSFGGVSAVSRSARVPKQSSSRTASSTRGLFSRSRSLRSGRVLRFESLEHRRVLATLTVTNLNDATVTGPGNAPGTLRQAIYDANASSDPDTIEFAPELSGDLRLSIADDSAISLSAFVINSPITIRGNTAGITIKRDITAPEMRFFHVALVGDLTLDSISLNGGITRGTNGTAGQNGGIAFGGAIYNQGNIQIIASTLYNNSGIGGNAGAGANSGKAQGGAIFNDGGNVVLRNATLSGNSVSNGFGFVFSGSFGGGIYSKNGLLTIDNSTITNSTAASGRELYIIGLGAGQTATAQFHSSIIAQADLQPTAYDVNATDDLGGQVIVTGSNNIIRSQNNLAQSMMVSSDDPLLGPLTTNGGPTRTHALLTDSPAIGHGTNLLNLVNDQRGDPFARVVGGAIDVGAYELQTVASPGLLGDYNTNHSVDAGDYVLWRKTKGADVPQFSGADGNGNSKVDDADFDIWRGNFGAVSPASAAAAEAQSISLAFDTQAETQATHLNESVLFDAFGESELSSSGRFGAQSDHRQPKREVPRPITQPQRDDALLAITAVRFAPQHSAFAKSHSSDGSEPDMACSAGTDNLLPTSATLLYGVAD